ncbi:RICIN domain-containing protein [Micromonospora sp. NPDC049044]|uniref:RICIN domain-containing protein n=1 Tax=Micromonospora sp. NPDC049044 TaxID=3154827 RepID=UPI0033E0B14E
MSALLLPLVAVVPSSPATAAGIGTVMEVRIDPAGAQWGEAVAAAQIVGSTGIGDTVWADGAYGGYSGQRWNLVVREIDSAGRWTVELRNLRYSNICLDEYIGQGVVKLYTCNGKANQRWKLWGRGKLSNGIEVFNLENKATENCLFVGFLSAYPGSCLDDPLFAIVKL